MTYILLHFFLSLASTIYLIAASNSLLRLLVYRNMSIFKNSSAAAIPAIRITGLGTSTPKAVTVAGSSETRKRASLGLLSMLRAEYGDTYQTGRSNKVSADLMRERNPRLADITPGQAIVQLRSELKEYSTGNPPFNEPFDSEKPTRLWWIRMHKDPRAKILGVCSHLQSPISIVNAEC
jgi:hypothetical protein